MNTEDINKDYAAIWNTAIHRINSDLPKQDIDLWFSRIHFFDYQNDKVIISVPSNFHRDQIRSRYLDILEQTLSEVAHSNIQVEFRITTEFSKSEVNNVKPLSQNILETEKSNSKKNKSILAQANVHSQFILKQEYTFENFVIGDNNSFAANAAVAIAKNPGTSYNPCFLYGGVGLGKTHLLQSVANSVHQDFPDLKIIYVTMETYMNEFIQSIRERKQSAFKNKYRRADIFLLDDVHFLQKKPETQEELFHTFNALYDLNKQMVFTCDRPFTELKNLTERLKSRFSRGLTLDLQPPDYETRRAILNKKIELAGVSIPEESVALICENITTNVRDLEAALTRLIAYSDLVNKSITIEITKQQLKDYFASSTIQKNISINNIQQVVAEYFSVTIQELKSKRRTNTIVVPRQVAMYIAREITEYSTTEIGLEFGGRDHTTVMHSCDRVKDRMKSDPYFAEQLASLKKRIVEQSMQV